MTIKQRVRAGLPALACLLVPVATPATLAETGPTGAPAAKPATSGEATVKPWAAPVGHRQPRASDIPATVEQDDLAVRLDAINRKLDRDLKICRGC
jgi:hypothetical protein